MDIYTCDRGFIRQELIDEFESAIWVERYAGDGDFELSVPSTADMKTKLTKGTIMMLEDSDEPMILETRDINKENKGLLKATGITLTQWLNNRFIRTSADHTIKEWHLTGFKPGEALVEIVQQMCIGGPYLTGATPIGIPAAQTILFAVPGLVTGPVWDTSGAVVDLTVPYGPVYEALNAIATTYDVGMKIVLVTAVEGYFQISFYSYKGADRTSDQAVNPVIRFSSDMDSFINVGDLESLTEHRNSVYVFAPSAPPAQATNAGHAESVPMTEPSFDLRLFQGFADDVPTVPDAAALLSVLNQKALTEVQSRKEVALVDGQIVEIEGHKYGTDFFLGDVVEVEGNTEVIQKARITEYIRSQDSAGERAYPTLAMI